MESILVSGCLCIHVSKVMVLRVYTRGDPKLLQFLRFNLSYTKYYINMLRNVSSI